MSKINSALIPASTPTDLIQNMIETRVAEILVDMNQSLFELSNETVNPSSKIPKDSREPYKILMNGKYNKCYGWWLHQCPVTGYWYHLGGGGTSKRDPCIKRWTVNEEGEGKWTKKGVPQDNAVYLWNTYGRK